MKETRIKRVLAIFLLVTFVASVTAMSVSADPKQTNKKYMDGYKKGFYSAYTYEYKKNVAKGYYDYEHDMYSIKSAKPSKNPFAQKINSEYTKKYGNAYARGFYDGFRDGQQEGLVDGYLDGYYYFGEEGNYYYPGAKGPRYDPYWPS